MTTRRLDIAIASYKNPAKLRNTLNSLSSTTVADWRCYVIHNHSEDDNEVWEVIGGASARDKRFIPVWLEENIGYVGAVNKFFTLAETDYIAYCDNDIEIQTAQWDEKLCAILDANPEVGQVFPGSGHYGFFNGSYHECLWNAGYCWVMRRSALKSLYASDIKHRRCADPGKLDTTLGHHEEVDLMIRLRLAGFQIGCDPDVSVLHHETATNADAADHKPGGRIHDGVVRWMNKWNQYFCGDQLKYSMTAYDEKMLRYTDWPPCSLYLERWVKSQQPNWNITPKSVPTTSGPMDAIEVLKPQGCYAGRAL